LSDQIHFIDKSFDFNDTKQYHLSLQVFLRGFSFSVLDRSKNKYIAIGHFVFDKITSFRACISQIDTIMANEPLLKIPYQHVKLLFATSRFTFVPSSFFDKQQINTWFEFNHEKVNSETILDNYIFGNSTYTVFGVPTIVIQYFKERFPFVKIFHQSVPMIDELMLKSKQDDDSTKVFLNIYSTFFDFILMEKGNLKLYNSFNFQSVTDFNYYFLNVFDKLKLSPLDIPVFISGIIAKDHEIIESVKKYIRQTGYLEIPSHFEYAYGFNDFPHHYFTNMINLYQCG
jgi:hypothetical protein